MSRTNKDQLVWQITNIRNNRPENPDELRDWHWTHELRRVNPDAPGYVFGVKFTHPKPDRKDIRGEGWCPDRRRTREACQATAREYNITGQVITEPPVFQHHHGVASLH
ncbi:hypothetical protein GCM10009733_020650 [Nonomuraea maheshkhaliensis]|uniref:Uncharacterized protein n=1 Tax=Nonomuraea maheshkhaliensis TaxID=419590 RepID=A0ABP4QVC9_9ACTN